MSESTPEDPQPSLSASHVAALVAHHRELVAYVERRVRDHALAEDIVQDAFVRGLEREMDVRESALGWLYRMLRNAVIDRARRRTVESARLEAFARELEATTAPDDEWQGVTCRCVRDLARTLRPEHAEILEKVELEGQPVKDFAAEHGLSPSNAGVRVFRARKALRERVIRACGTCATHGCLDCTCGASPCA